MEIAEVPSPCAVALKEWASVLEALRRGEQMILLRKGGLIEPSGGFELKAKAFAFYPTFEHHAARYLRPPYQPYVEEAARRRAPKGQVGIELCGVVAFSTQSRDPGIIERLSAFHIYNEAFVTQRLTWQPAQPLVVGAIRAFRLASPQVIPMAARYAGCTSWIELESPIPFEGASAVLDEATFHDRTRELAALLA